MAKRSLTRREFLKASALGTSAVALNGCTNLDRYFMGDKRNLKTEVLILGAGAAGLAAAFELKKKKIPFRVFEASSRVGGRVQSVTNSATGGPWTELGAEFFENSHGHVFDLAKELNLPVREIKGDAKFEAHLFSFEGKNLSSQRSGVTLPNFAEPFASSRAVISIVIRMLFLAIRTHCNTSVRNITTHFHSKIF